MTTQLLSLTPNLMVDNVNETIEYYKDHLGFETIMTVPETGQFNWAMLQRDKVVIMLQQTESIIEEYPMLKSDLKGGNLTLYIDVKDIKTLYKALKNKKSIEFAKELGETFYGTNEFAIVDCNGYVLTFSEK